MGTAADTRDTNRALAVTNVVLGLLVLSIAGGFVYFQFFYEPQVDPGKTERYVAEAQERLEQHSDVIAAEAAALAQDALPPIGEAIYQQAQEDYPVYIRAFKTEGREYLGNVEDILLAKVKAKYGGYLRAHRDVLKEEFPEHASDENVAQVLSDFETVTNRIIERYYLDEFRREADRTVALWHKVETVEPPGSDDPSLQEQLADYAADWTVLAVADKTEPTAAEKQETDE